MTRIFSNTTNIQGWAAYTTRPWPYNDTIASNFSPRTVSREYSISSDILRTPVRMGWREPLPYSRTIIRGDYLPRLTYDVVRLVNGVETNKYTMSGWATDQMFTALPTFPSDLTNQAMTRALNKLKQQNVNLAVAFGERKATARHMADTARRIANAGRAARKLQFADAARILVGSSRGHRNSRKPRAYKSVNDREVANGWLELQYGWLPLYSDVYGSVKELHEKDDRFKDRYTVSTKIKSSHGISDTTVTVTEAAGNSCVVEIYLRTRMRQNVLVRLDYSLNNPIAATLSELGITNPAQVAWELVPFSFVVDWFLPIGSFLSALDAGTGWTFKGGTTTTTTRSNCTASKRNWTVNSNIPSNEKRVLNHLSVSGRLYQLKMDRIVHDVAPTPGLPSFNDDPFSNRRVASAISLLAQAFR